MFRIGNGFDVHPFAENRKLIIGGVELPYHLGLLGHSDADVLVHAICDALLGAVSLGDIGKHFPDSDDRYRGADSLTLMKHVHHLISDQGYMIVNIDTQILCQKPKLAPFMSMMKDKLCNTLDIQQSQLNIAATTTEKLGFIGREEGIAAYAVCLLRQSG